MSLFGHAGDLAGKRGLMTGTCWTPSLNHWPQGCNHRGQGDGNGGAGGCGFIHVEPRLGPSEPCQLPGR